MLNDDSTNKPERIYLNFNANKIRWLAESKITPSNVFCIGSGESLVCFRVLNKKNKTKIIELFI